MQKKILWVLFFHQVEKMFSYFQNHTGRMIFLKMVLNFIFLKISHVKLKAISFLVRFLFLIWGWCATFWFKSLDNNMVYTLGIYVYIYIYITTVTNAEKILVGFISISWGFARHFSKSRWLDDFFINGLRLHRPSGYFWDKISGFIFFLFRLIFEGIFLPEGEFNFCVNFFLNLKRFLL